MVGFYFLFLQLDMIGNIVDSKEVKNVNCIAITDEIYISKNKYNNENVVNTKQIEIQLLSDIHIENKKLK